MVISVIFIIFMELFNFSIFLFMSEELYFQSLYDFFIAAFINEAFHLLYSVKSYLRTEIFGNLFHERVVKRMEPYNNQNDH